MKSLLTTRKNKRNLVATSHVRHIDLLNDPYRHDDVINWKHFPCYWPFVRGIHRPPVNSPDEGQWRIISSHNLEIERGRYVRPRVKPEQRRCVVCNVMDDEIHFVTQCRINACERGIFYQKMSSADPQFTSLNDKEKFTYLMQSNEQETLRWFAKYIYKSFHTRNELIYNPSK